MFGGIYELVVCSLWMNTRWWSCLLADFIQTTWMWGAQSRRVVVLDRDATVSLVLWWGCGKKKDNRGERRQRNGLLTQRRSNVVDGEHKVIQCVFFSSENRHWADNDWAVPSFVSSCLAKHSLNLCMALWTIGYWHLAWIRAAMQCRWRWAQA